MILDLGSIPWDRWAREAWTVGVAMGICAPSWAELGAKRQHQIARMFRDFCHDEAVRQAHIALEREPAIRHEDQRV